MALPLQTQIDVARLLATTLFGQAQAHANSTDILNAVQGFDNALDLTLSAAVTALGGGTTVINGLAASVTAPVGSSWTNAEKALIGAYVLEARANLIS